MFGGEEEAAFRLRTWSCHATEKEANFVSGDVRMYLLYIQLGLTQETRTVCVCRDTEGEITCGCGLCQQ